MVHPYCRLHQSKHHDAPRPAPDQCSGRRGIVLLAAAPAATDLDSPHLRGFTVHVPYGAALMLGLEELDGR
jgi:hypothetical protein